MGRLLCLRVGVLLVMGRWVQCSEVVRARCARPLAQGKLKVVVARIAGARGAYKETGEGCRLLVCLRPSPACLPTRSRLFTCVGA